MDRLKAVERKEVTNPSNLPEIWAGRNCRHVSGHRFYGLTAFIGWFFEDFEVKGIALNADTHD